MINEKEFNVYPSILKMIIDDFIKAKFESKVSSIFFDCQGLELLGLTNKELSELNNFNIIPLFT